MNKTKKLLSLFILIITLLTISSCVNKNNKDIENIDYSNSKISYLGPIGTYSEEASLAIFNNQGTHIPFNTVSDAVKALKDKEVNYAVIPQENTIGGAVIDYIDIVLENENLFIVSEIELTISQNLLVLDNTKLEDIKTIYSHKQGISQGKAWIDKNIPNAKLIEVSSTAEGAKIVSENQDKSIAAIASKGAASVYNLNVLADNIQENDNNKTRFYALSLEKNNISNGDRLAFVAKGKSSNLPSLMSKINSKGKDLITIHERPLKTSLGEYYYLIEIANCSYDDYKIIINNDLFNYRYLGSFNI